MNMLSKLTVTIAAAGAALAVAAALSAPASADGSLANKCVGNSKGEVLSCCKTWVKRNGKPLWMMQSNSSCETAVVCRARPPVVRLAPAADTASPMDVAIALPRCFIDQQGPGTKGGNTLQPPKRGNTPG
ncbi:MAG: hypothetical protein KGO53_12505 [Alphaproteobacteria bacterium]|nr:hypothetical protein [Alphaproteobacteria bacterium]